jgi:hypothetical protein
MLARRQAPNHDVEHGNEDEVQERGHQHAAAHGRCRRNAARPRRRPAR